MKRTVAITLVVFFSFVSLSYGGALGELLKGVKIPGGAASRSDSLDEGTVVKGLKEALSIGTGNAVTSVSKLDGYFTNQLIKILMPEKIQTAANVLGKLGYQKQVDDFVLSMNRAAEKAAPVAKKFFIDAVKEMTFEDAMKILKGSDTAATEYFKTKTFNKIYDAFKPTVSDSMNKVGVTKAYKDMVGNYTTAVPFGRMESLDLDHYVTTKALDGLFLMVGEEEKKIRTQPAARVTDILRTVFGKK
jgi:RNA binding exosome subunit